MHAKAGTDAVINGCKTGEWKSRGMCESGPRMAKDGLTWFRVAASCRLQKTKRLGRIRSTAVTYRRLVIIRNRIFTCYTSRTAARENEKPTSTIRYLTQIGLARAPSLGLYSHDHFSLDSIQQDVRTEKKTLKETSYVEHSAQLQNVVSICYFPAH